MTYRMGTCEPNKPALSSAKPVIIFIFSSCATTIAGNFMYKFLRRKILASQRILTGTAI